jgi:hypothetical protein
MAESSLNVGILAQLVAAPRKGAGGGLMLSLLSVERRQRIGKRKSTYSRSQKGQHLVDKFAVSKITALHHGAKNIRFQCFRVYFSALQCSSLVSDRLMTQIAEEANFSIYDLVQPPGQPFHYPLRQGKVHGQKRDLLPAWLQDSQETVGYFVLRVSQGLEVTAHGSRPDDIESEAAVRRLVKSRCVYKSRGVPYLAQTLSSTLPALSVNIVPPGFVLIPFSSSVSRIPVFSHINGYKARMFLILKAGVSALRCFRCAPPSERMRPKPMMRARKFRTSQGFSKSYVFVLITSKRAWWFVASRKLRFRLSLKWISPSFGMVRIQFKGVLPRGVSKRIFAWFRCPWSFIRAQERKCFLSRGGSPP